VKTSFAAEGDIRSVDILAALVGLWREGASGALHFSRSGATAGFQLSAGEVTGVTSSESRFETAAILLRAGKLEAPTMDRLVTPQGSDRALAALHAGILTKREWRWGEKIRAVEVLSDLLTWIEGDYVFDRGAHVEAGEFRLTVPRLILELFLRSRDRGLILHYLGGADVPLARASHFESEFAAFGLTADAEAVVRLIDGKATAAHIASEGPAEPFAVEKLLAALVTLGLVHPEFAAPEAAPIPEPSEREESPEPPEPTFEPARAAEVDERDQESLGAAEEEEADAPEEPEVAAPYSELDVPPPPPSEEPVAEPRFDEGSDGDLEEDLRETSEAEGEVGSSAVGDYEIVEPPEFPEPPRPPEAEQAEARLEYESLHERSHALTPEPELPGAESLEAEERPRVPLDFATGVGPAERPRPRSGGRWLWLLVLLAAGVGAVIVLRGRGTASRTAALVESPTPAPVPTGEAAVLSPMTSPVPTETAPAATAAPNTASRGAAGTAIAATTIVAPARAPTAAATRPPASPIPKVATPRPVPPTTAPQRSTPAPAEPAGSTRQSWLDRAARDRQKANADRRNHFTIQAELACETQTLIDAWKYDRPAGTLWVLTTPYDGKTCFRVLWGRYPSKEAARRALSGVPPFFSSNHNKPVVTAIR
jgi:hypothetical protein